MADTNSLGETFIREFVAPDPENGRKMGRLILRLPHYGHTLKNFDNLFVTMICDAKEFKPPLELKNTDVEVMHYGGERYAKTYGLEASIPAEYEVPESYTRIPQVEFSL